MSTQLTCACVTAAVCLGVDQLFILCRCVLLNLSYAPPRRVLVQYYVATLTKNETQARSAFQP